MSEALQNILSDPDTKQLLLNRIWSIQSSDFFSILPTVLPILFGLFTAGSILYDANFIRISEDVFVNRLIEKLDEEDPIKNQVFAGRNAAYQAVGGWPLLSSTGSSKRELDLSRYLPTIFP